MRNNQKILALLNAERKKFALRRVRLSVDKNLKYDELVRAAFSVVDVQYSRQKVDRAHNYVKKIVDSDQAVYGITTSFGGNIKNVISPSKSQLLQHNLVGSHSANVGAYLPYEICKTALILRSVTLAKGYSGVSQATLDFLIQLLKRGVIPAIPGHGSMGASGDLGPLSAMARVLIGDGNIYTPNKVIKAVSRQTLQKYGLKQITLNYRDGLALINGTTVMTSIGSFNLWYLKRLIENSLVISALSIEGIRSSKEPFDKDLHNLKPHANQINVAKVMRGLLRDSNLAQSHQQLKEVVDKKIRHNHSDVSLCKTDLQGGSYSFRAIPQVYQPVVALFKIFEQSIDTEINAIDDNPLILPEKEKLLHGANFHGHPISVMADSMNTALVSIANMSNARLDRILKSQYTGLPAFLATGREGLYLGLQGLQYTAAGICAELRNLAHPLSINQITTNNDNQDMVSFGLQATQKGLEMTVLLAYVLAAEYIAAGQAIWLRITNEGYPRNSMAPITRAAYAKLLKIYSPKKNRDQAFTEAIEQIAELLLLESLLPEKLADALWKKM